MTHIDRRTTIKWVLAVAASAAVPVSAVQMLMCCKGSRLFVTVLGYSS
jgi:hypothetical protein